MVGPLAAECEIDGLVRYLASEEFPVSLQTLSRQLS